MRVRFSPRAHMTIVVVVPAYNEGATMGELIKILMGRVFPLLFQHRWHLLVVDDSTTGDIETIVRERMTRYDNLHLLRGTARGLGDAVVRGFHYAMIQLRADAVARIDADFQHDPADLPRFVAALENGADYILGSRLIAGGSLPARWGWGRRFLAVGGNYFIRTMLYPWNIRDSLTDFRLVRVKGVLDQVDFSQIRCRSSAYRIELLALLKNAGAKIIEIPIHFASRRDGASKLTLRDFSESIGAVLRLRFRPGLRL